MRISRSLPLTSLVITVITLALASVMAAPAFAGPSPWWQLDSLSTPGNLHSGVATSEVQELTVSATGGKCAGVQVGKAAEEVQKAKEEVEKAKSEGNKKAQEEAEKRQEEAEKRQAAAEKAEAEGKAGCFLIGKTGEFEQIVKFNATPQELQEKLEEMYGAGNVEVTEGEGDATGSKPYKVIFKGALADKAVPPFVAGQLPPFGIELTGGQHQASVVEVSKGRPDGQLVVSASNMGDAEVDGSSGAPVVLRDKLPAGLLAKSAVGKAGDASYVAPKGEVKCSVVSSSLVECTFEGKLASYEPIEVEIGVEVLPVAKSGESSEVTVSGGGAAAASLERPIVVSDAPTPFGPANYEFTAFNENGSVDTQAGSHPYALTTVLDLNRTAEAPYQPAQPKDLRFNLPPGLVGNPTPFPQCSTAQFESRSGPAETNECPADTVLGVAAITIHEPIAIEGAAGTIVTPVFNLKPSAGEPARFGFVTAVVNVTLDTSVRTGGDYGVTVSSNNISQIAGLLDTRVTFWGVPGDTSHNGSRGWGCLDQQGACEAPSQSSPPPFLSLPTSCTGPLQTTVQGDSWAQKGVFTEPFSPTSEPSLDGCNRLPFEPSISVAPDSQAGSSPSGLTVGVHVPQDSILSAKALAESTVKDTAVTLPAGVALNPAAADGLQACSEAQIALSADSGPTCPEAAKVGTVEIKTPLLPNPLTGEAYLAAQNANPFGSLVALYIVAEDPVSGTLIKLAGEVKPDPVTGQLVSTFKNTPQLPFEDLSLHFFGGSRAPLGTPALCGSYTTTTSIAPWSGNAAGTPSSTFQIVSGPGGGACFNPLPFAPSLTAGMTNINAGAFSPFTMTMSREDGQQNLKAIQLHMPAGLSGVLTGVTLCGEPQADAGTCGPESLIGETTVSVGLGGNPFSVKGGKVYITGPYAGAPFGLSIVNPAKAGPYDLGKGACDCVLVRAKIELDPHTAALTITSDDSGPYAIPPLLDGIPLQIKHVNVTIDRGGGQGDFTFNPTNCSPLSITGSLSSIEGATSALSVPFQATNCKNLQFAPKFQVTTSGKTSRSKGASLSVKLIYPKAPFGSQANIARVKVDLPKQLPSRLTTLQKACTAAQFALNPANCPKASFIGHAKAITPLLPVPLEGPAIFVSHGGEAFPSLIVVLQGYGVTLDLVGSTFISKAGITSSTFKTVPDAPVGSFELNLPEGKFSALAANGNLCKSKLAMPTEFLAQNGAKINQSTPISVTGCAKKKALTRAQKLKAALKVCHKQKGSSRLGCEKAAHRKYGPAKKAKRGRK
jgi:hypothetical protein